MPRRKKPRFVTGYPSIDAFVPRGDLQTGQISLSVEGLEAIRLTDFEGLDQETAAGIMQVSRQTYGRILGSARFRIAEALVTGKDLVVQGGDFVLHGRGGRQRRRGRNRKW